MNFDLNNSLPIWMQLEEQIKERIVTGKYRAGEGFPTVRELAAEAGVNPNTMQRAMAKLEADGLLITNRTAGRTVTDNQSVIDNTRALLARERTEKFLREMNSLGYSNKEAYEFLKEGNEK